MSQNKSNRRTFLKQGITVGAGLTLARTAIGQARTLGANDRINIALIGCGHRGQHIVGTACKGADENIALVAVCDIWQTRLGKAADEMGKVFGKRPQLLDSSQKVLDNPDIDAVVIGTPDHQHAGQTIDAVQAGKHVYVEKPIIGLACDLPELNKWHDVIKGSKMVVQNGTQGVSCPAARALKQLIADNKLGKLFRVEGTETAFRPYWAGYPGPTTEADTNWKAWLYNRADRPFDANMHAKWMGYKEITSGTIGGWMTHFTNMVHFVTGCEAPVSGAAWGGKYALTNDPKCTAPDQTMVILEYAEGFHTQFTSHFGSALNDETIVFMFEKGNIRTCFGHWLKNPVVSNEGTVKPEEVKSYKLFDAEQPYPSTAHAKNWLDCIRNGGRPNADVEFGYKQGVAVALGDLAWDLGCKVTFDKTKREVRAMKCGKA